MPRAIAEPLFFFAIPFAAYALFLLTQLVNPLHIDNWTRKVVVPLSLVGVVLAVSSLLFIGLRAPRYEGAYVPAHIENGRLMPGRTQ